MAARPPPIGLVATDLDGTLLGSNHTLGARDDASLRALGRSGVVRVIATGRSLRATDRVLDRAFPVDYLVVSSGAGILEWNTRRILHRREFEPADARRIRDILSRFEVDFMAHDPVPNDHRFRFVQARAANADFERRIGRYREFATPWRDVDCEGGPGEGAGTIPDTCQFVAILEPGETALHERLRHALSEFSVVRSTSPLDGRSIWVEVRPRAVGKERAIAWLAARYRLGPGETAAIGNDYNDVGMLRWSDNSFVVANAAPELREQYRVVSSNDAGGFSDVVAVVSRDGGGFARAAAPVEGRTPAPG